VLIVRDTADRAVIDLDGRGRSRSQGRRSGTLFRQVGTPPIELSTYTDTKRFGASSRLGLNMT
jgi:hypothetical protein